MKTNKNRKKEIVKTRMNRVKASLSVWLVVLTFYGTKVYATATEATPTTPSDLPTGSWIKDWILIIAQNVFVVLLAIGAVKAFGKKAWVTFVTLAIAGAITAFFVYFPTEAVELLKKFGGKIGD